MRKTYLSCRACTVCPLVLPLQSFTFSLHQLGFHPDHSTDPASGFHLISTYPFSSISGFSLSFLKYFLLLVSGILHFPGFLPTTHAAVSVFDSLSSIHLTPKDRRPRAQRDYIRFPAQSSPCPLAVYMSGCSHLREFALALPGTLFSQVSRVLTLHFEILKSTSLI